MLSVRFPPITKPDRPIEHSAQNQKFSDSQSLVWVLCHQSDRPFSFSPIWERSQVSKLLSAPTSCPESDICLGGFGFEERSPFSSGLINLKQLVSL
ncbi:hypothetical protein [Trichocoleus sp. FACHB-46]|nr:hypothetical protein [Trichocoleus sp. FACHB-46]